MSFQGPTPPQDGPNSHNGQVPPMNQHQPGQQQQGQPFSQPQQPSQIPGQVPGQPPQMWQQQVPPKKNWFARHKVLTAVLAIIALIIVAASLGGGEDADAPTADATTSQEPSPSEDASQKPDATESSESKEEEKPKEEPKEEPKAEPAAEFKIGDAATVGDVQYTVTKVKTADSVGADFMAEKAKGKYVVVSVEVQNNGNESITITDSFFKLKAGDKVFEADSVATLTANSDSDGDSFFYEELNPDLSASGVVVFDVSEKTSKAKDNILQAQTGFWGTETVDILLAK